MKVDKTENKTVNWNNYFELWIGWNSSIGLECTTASEIDPRKSINICFLFIEVVLISPFDSTTLKPEPNTRGFRINLKSIIKK